MSKELQELLCSCCRNDNLGANDRYVSQTNDYFTDDDCNDNDDSPRYDTSDACDRLQNDSGGLDDDSLEALSSLKQKFYQLEKSEVKRNNVKPRPRSAYEYTNRHSVEDQSLVEKANSLINYTPESEFLRKIKQQCQYLQNRLPNIFSALNDCFPETGPHENQRLKSDLDECKEPPRLRERKSEHISRSRKPLRRKLRKRKTKAADRSESVNGFEPSLKKPSENSCERCWRFASPARSPVNKPDQRYDPNFRRAHSAVSFERRDRGEFLKLDTGKVFSEGQEMDPDAHINITQRVEPAPPIQHLCPKHRFQLEVPPVPVQNPCPRHRASPQQPLPVVVPGHQCSRNRPSLQQSESFQQAVQPVPRHRCSVHAQESVRPNTPFLPQGPTSFAKVREVAHSPRKKGPCRHISEDEASRAILYSSPGRKARGNGCTSEGFSRATGRSPNATNELDVTEYKDIYIKPKHQSSGPGSTPCKTGRSHNATNELDVTEYKDIYIKPKHQSSGPGSTPCKTGRSHNATNELDVTEYKDIYIKPKHQSSGAGSTPCRTGRSANVTDEFDVTEYNDVCMQSKKQSPCYNRTDNIKSHPCGICPKPCPAPKSPRPCGQPKLQSIPEKRYGKPQEADSERKRSGMDSSGGDARGSKDRRGSKDGKGSRDERGSKDGRGSKGTKDNYDDNGDYTMDSRDSNDFRDSRSSKERKGNKEGKERKGKKSPKEPKSRKQAPEKKKKSPKPKSDNVKPKRSPDRSKIKSEPLLDNSCAKKIGQFDKAHPIRHCRCFPRIPETEGLSENQGHVLCCHCDWEENRKADVSSMADDKTSGYANRKTGNSLIGGSCLCSNSPPPPSRLNCPENNRPPPSREQNMECPYRALMNRCGGGLVKPQGGENDRWYSRDYYTGNSTQDQSFLQCPPRKYFVFYMTKANAKNENDVEVLVEEFGQGCPDESVSRTKGLTEKLKKISEPPPDSMALRFQKGVSEACGVPQSSRVLYF